MDLRSTVAIVLIGVGSNGPVFGGHFHPRCLEDYMLRLTTAGGGIELNESPMAAAIRELGEEYGIHRTHVPVEVIDLSLGPIEGGDSGKLYRWYVVTVPSSVPICPNPFEVYGFGWYGGKGGVDFMCRHMSGRKQEMFRQVLGKARHHPRLRRHLRNL